MAIASLAVVLALGFGASEVFAENATLVCPYRPPAELGVCISEADCDIQCAQQPGYTAGSYGECQFDGCCACFL